PRDANALIGLAVLREKSGDFQAAEQSYQAATRVSKRYRSYASMAMFYFREDRQSLFWAWEAKSVAVDAANPEAMFRMSLQISQSHREIPLQLKLESQGALTSYLTFLLREGSLENVADVAQKLDLRAAHQELLLTACDRLLDAGQTDDAARIWNRLGAYGNTT